MKCAAYELPFKAGERFGSFETEEVLEYLAEERVLYQNGDKYYWMNDSFPAHNISLRSASQENVDKQEDDNNEKIISRIHYFNTSCF